MLYFKTKEKDTCAGCVLLLPPAQPLGTVITFSANSPLLSEELLLEENVVQFGSGKRGVSEQAWSSRGATGRQ